MFCQFCFSRFFVLCIIQYIVSYNVKVEKDLDAKNLPTLRRAYPVSEEELQELMNSPPAMVCMNIHKYHKKKKK